MTSIFRLFLRIAAVTYPRRFAPAAVLVAVIGMTAMILAVLQFQGPMMRSVPAHRELQLCQSVGPSGNGELYTAYSC